MIGVSFFFKYIIRYIQALHKYYAIFLRLRYIGAVKLFSNAFDLLNKTNTCMRQNKNCYYLHAFSIYLTMVVFFIKPLNLHIRYNIIQLYVLTYLQ